MRTGSALKPVRPVALKKRSNEDKNKAFEAMNKWVKEFYEVAKIALSDRPQLLESIGKLVKS